jgi:hypothetical protein
MAEISRHTGKASKQITNGRGTKAKRCGTKFLSTEISININYCDTWMPATTCLGLKDMVVVHGCKQQLKLNTEVNNA